MEESRVCSADMAQLRMAEGSITKCIELERESMASYRQHLEDEGSELLLRQRRRLDGPPDAAASEKTAYRDENDIVQDAVRNARIGRFPFFRGSDVAPTPLDRLTLHPALLALASNILMNHDEQHRLGIFRSSQQRAVHYYPRLMDAFVVCQANCNRDHSNTTMLTTHGNDRRLIDYYSSQSLTDSIGNTDNNNDNLLDAIVLTIRLAAHHINPDDQDTAQAFIKVSSLKSTAFDPFKSSSAQTPETTLLRIIYRHPQSTSFQLGDTSFIRYMEKANSTWLATMTPNQRTAIGFPSPQHEYWKNNQNVLQQVINRFKSTANNKMCFDPSPYYNHVADADAQQLDKKKKKRNTNNQGHSCCYSTTTEMHDDCPVANSSSISTTTTTTTTSIHPEDTFRDLLRLIPPEQLPPPPMINNTNNNNNNIKNSVSLLSKKQIQQFQEEGYLFLNNIFPSHVLQDAIDASHDLWPNDFQLTLLQRHQSNTRRSNTSGLTTSTTNRNNNGNNRQQPYTPRSFSFPFIDSRLNAITLDPQLLSIIAQLLCVNVNQVRIMQSACFAKRGTSPWKGNENNTCTNMTSIQQHDQLDNEIFMSSTTSKIDNDTKQTWTDGNQPMHMDFGSNSLLTPARGKMQWLDVEEVQGILYYNNHDEVGGGTSFVPGLRHSDADPAHLGWLPYPYASIVDDPRTGLYPQERRVAYSKGSLFLFQLGTWHRGTPVQNGAIRRVHHLCFRKASATWVGGCAEFGDPTLRSFRQLEDDSRVSYNVESLLNKLKYQIKQE